MGKKLKLIFLTDIYWPSKGGIEEAIRALSEYFVCKFKISIVNHARNSNKPGMIHKTFMLPSFEEYIDKAGNRVIPLTPNVIQRIFMLPFLVWHFPLLRRIGSQKLFDFLYLFYRSAYKKKLSTLIDNADIVHSFSTSFLAILATEICNKKHIPLIHTPFIHFNRWGDSPLQMHSYSLSSAMICPTESFRNEILKRIPDISEKITVIPPLSSPFPQNLPSYGQINIEKPFILFLGRREKHKGLEMLLKAFQQIDTSWKLVIAGPGEKIPSVSLRIIDLGEVIESTKHLLLSNCSIFCVPSMDESFGIVYIEAMSYSKPIIALDISPVNEIILNNITGLLAPKGDISALARLLSDLISNEKKRTGIGRAARKRYKEFYSRERVISEYEKIYSDAIQPKQARSLHKK